MSQIKLETMSCVMCEKIFFPNRKDARFCSAKCRKAANRKGISGKGKPYQASYDVAVKTIYKMAGYDAQNSIKSIALLALELLTDENKKKIWHMLRDYPFDEKS